MGGLLDLDAVVVETTEIKKMVDGEQKVWHLRDDMPPEVMLAVFGLMAHGEVQSQAITTLRETVNGEDAAQVERAIAVIGEKLQAQKRELTHICGEVFRHTYPATTDEEIQRWFTDEQRSQIVQLFFTRRLRESSPLSNSTTPEPTNPTSQDQENGANPNRATRRHSRHSGGAIPSQKRIKRELAGM